MRSINPNYEVFILTHGRPDRVFTYDTLRKSGYSGKIKLIVDDLDKTKEEYVERYKDEVIVFDKKESQKLFDVGDNFPSYKGVIYARNAAFEIAKNLGVKNFIVLDDDYRHFKFRFNDKLTYKPMAIKNLDVIFTALVEFLINTKVDSFAISQGGDFIGGDQSTFAQKIKLTRKLMNLFVCSTDRPFEFMGRINEDVNVYTNLGSRGKLFFTLNQLSLEQTQTQQNPGGMTELYLDSGTYVKSFYSVIYQPSCVKVASLQDRDHSRLHHRVIWENTVPKILRQT